MPTAKSVLGIAALIPAVVEPPNAQDVGGSKGERSVRITVHGGKTYDSRFGDRMRGNGPYAEMIAKRYRMARKKFDLDHDTPLDLSLFKRPGDTQMDLFL